MLIFIIQPTALKNESEYTQSVIANAADRLGLVDPVVVWFQAKRVQMPSGSKYTTSNDLQHAKLQPNRAKAPDKHGIFSDCSVLKHIKAQCVVSHKVIIWFLVL